MKHCSYISIIVLFTFFVPGCGLLNSDKDKNQKEPLYEWEKVNNLRSDWVTAIATHGVEELYVAQSNRLYYSKDGGKTFITTNAPDSADIKKIKIYDRLFIIGDVHISGGGFFGSTTSYVYASDDNGRNWEEITGRFIMQDLVISEGKLHIGRKHGVNTFDLKGDSLLYANKFIHSKLSDHIEEITASREGVIYLASHDGIHSSKDGGENWNRVSTNIDKDDDFIRSITIDDDNSMIYAVEYDRLYFKNFDANSWERKRIESGTNRVRLLNNNRIIISDWDGVYLADRSTLEFQNIGPDYEETENDILSFEYLEVLSNNKIVVAEFDHVFIGTPVKE